MSVFSFCCSQLQEEKETASDATKSLQMEVATSKDQLTLTEGGLVRQCPSCKNAIC